METKIDFCEELRKVAVVATGVANVASVTVALRRLGFSVELVSTPEAVSGARRLVLPGVGNFAAGMEALCRKNLVAALRLRLEERRPTLAICLGLQLLLEGSDESPGVPGLGFVPGMARRFDSSLTVPQMGWNRVMTSENPTIRSVLGSTEGGWAYFANSFRLEEPPQGFVTASADYGGRFVAAIEDGGVLACQFHPELSGQWGTLLLRRWLSLSAQREALC